MSANLSQEKYIVGKKLVKPADEGDEVPGRQGFLFEAFKIPDVPEETPEEVDEEGEAPPPKPAPVPVPLLIDNVMRDKRTNFFGIPKLGAFVAIPLSYQSIAHEAGCQSSSPDSFEAPFTMNKIPIQLIFCMDTIGKYRRFNVRFKYLTYIINSLILNPNELYRRRTLKLPRR